MGGDEDAGEPVRETLNGEQSVFCHMFQNTVQNTRNTPRTSQVRQSENRGSRISGFLIF
jgi:hypothetical protein